MGIGQALDHLVVLGLSESKLGGSQCAGGCSPQPCWIRQENLMAKKPRHILKYLEDPNTWDKSAFETAIRAEVEASTGALTASDEFLIGSLVLVVDSLLTAQINIAEAGHVTVYGNNEGVTAWYKIRTEMTDKAIKILAELGLVARGRPKMTNKVSDIDELFATA